MELKEAAFKIENNVLKGTEKKRSPKIEYTSLGEVMLDNMNKDPNFVSQVDGVTGETSTYEKVRDRSVRCALWMKAQGLRSKDVVLICTHNHLDVVMACYGPLYLGAIINPLDIALHENDFRHLMTITKPKVAFVNEDVATTIARAAEGIKLDLKIVVFGQVPGFPSFESIIAEAQAEDVKNFKCTQIENSDQTAVILSTSGTTGLPKGVALPHSGFLKQIDGTIRELMRPNALVFTPLAWFTGLFFIIMSACNNTPRIVPPPFEEYTACELIERYKISYCFMAPNMINRLLKSNAMKKYDLSSLKEVICGGSTLAIASRLAFEECLPNTVFTMGYGMTEVGTIISCQVSGSKVGSSGRIYEGVQVKVLDRPTGRILGPNEQGELLIKTNTMMNGYFNNPEATAQAIDEEGWMHSGDIGYYDEDGEIYVVDRFKELMKYRGYHISPVEIENVLSTHPGVKEVAVVGLPHPVDDEWPIAFVIKTDSSVYNKQLTEEELIDYVAGKVADSKRLRGGVKFVEYLPKTPSGKVQRRNVRALAASLTAT